MPADLVDEIRQVEGVDAAEASFGGYAQLVDLEGEPLTTTGAPFIGVSWGHEDRLRPATLDEGRAPDGLGEVAIDRGTAADYGFSVGDHTTVLLADGTQPEVEIVGIFTFGEANNLLGARLTAFDVDVAAEVFDTGDEVDSIDIVAADGVPPSELAARVQRVLPDGIESVTGTEVAAEGEEGIAGLMDAFRNILLGFAAVALFVSAFFINNTFSIVVGQRTRQLALLRAVGASAGQITRSVVGEALVVGALASAVGIGFGLLIALVLQAILNAAGFGLPDQGLVLASRTVAAAVGRRARRDAHRLARPRPASIDRATRARDAGGVPADRLRRGPAARGPVAGSRPRSRPRRRGAPGRRRDHDHRRAARDRRPRGVHRRRPAEPRRGRARRREPGPPDRPAVPGGRVAWPTPTPSATRSARRRRPRPS